MVDNLKDSLHQQEEQQKLGFQFDSCPCFKKNLVLIKKKSKLCFLHSSVAQLVEQLTVNQLVAGSSPARGAKKNF